MFSSTLFAPGWMEGRSTTGEQVRAVGRAARPMMSPCVSIFTLWCVGEGHSPKGLLWVPGRSKTFRTSGGKAAEIHSTRRSHSSRRAEYRNFPMRGQAGKPQEQTLFGHSKGVGRAGEV